MLLEELVVRIDAQITGLETGIQQATTLTERYTLTVEKAGEATDSSFAQATTAAERLAGALEKMGTAAEGVASVQKEAPVQAERSAKAQQAEAAALNEDTRAVEANTQAKRLNALEERRLAESRASVLARIQSGAIRTPEGATPAGYLGPLGIGDHGPNRAQYAMEDRWAQFMQEEEAGAAGFAAARRRVLAGIEPLAIPAAATEQVETFGAKARQAAEAEEMLALANRRTGESFAFTMLKYMAVAEVFSKIAEAARAAFDNMVNVDYQAARTTRLGGFNREQVASQLRLGGALTGLSPEQTGEAYYQLGTYIHNSGDLAKAFRNELQLINATEGDARATTRATIQVFEDFGDQLGGKNVPASEKMRRANELLAISFKNSNQEIGETAQALKYLAPMLEAANVSAAQGFALMSALTAQGVRGRMEGTEAGSFLTRLIKTYNPEEQGIEFKDKVFHFEQVRDASGQLDLFKTLEDIYRRHQQLLRTNTEEARQYYVGIGNSAQAIRFLGGLSDEFFQRYRDQLKQSTDATYGFTHTVSEMNAEMMKTASKEMASAWQSFLGVLGTGLTDIYNKLREIQGLRDLVKGWRNDLNRDAQSHLQAQNLLTQTPLQHAQEMQRILQAAVSEQQRYESRTAAAASSLFHQPGLNPEHIPIDELKKAKGLLPSEVDALLQLVPKRFDEVSALARTSPLDSGKIRYTTREDLEAAIAKIHADMPKFQALQAAADRAASGLSNLGNSANQLSIIQVADLARQAGFAANQIPRAVAIAMAESSLQPGNQSPNRNRAGQVTSIDRGLWQINDHFHSEISNAQAFDPLQNAIAAFNISKGGTDWRQWTTFRTGAFEKFLPQVQQALKGGYSGPSITQKPGGADNAERDALRDQESVIRARLSHLEKLVDAGVGGSLDAVLKKAQPLAAQLDAITLKAAKKEGDLGTLEAFRLGDTPGKEYLATLQKSMGSDPAAQREKQIEIEQKFRETLNQTNAAIREERDGELIGLAKLQQAYPGVSAERLKYLLNQQESLKAEKQEHDLRDKLKQKLADYQSELLGATAQTDKHRIAVTYAGKAYESLSGAAKQLIDRIAGVKKQLEDAAAIEKVRDLFQKGQERLQLLAMPKEQREMISATGGLDVWKQMPGLQQAIAASATLHAKAANEQADKIDKAREALQRFHEEMQAGIAAAHASLIGDEEEKAWQERLQAKPDLLNLSLPDLQKAREEFHKFYMEHLNAENIRKADDALASYNEQMKESVAVLQAQIAGTLNTPEAQFEQMLSHNKEMAAKLKNSPEDYQQAFELFKKEYDLKPQAEAMQRFRENTSEAKKTLLELFAPSDFARFKAQMLELDKDGNLKQIFSDEQLHKMFDTQRALEYAKQFADGLRGTIGRVFDDLMHGGRHWLTDLVQGFTGTLQKMASDFLASQFYNLIMKGFGGLFGAGGIPGVAGPTGINLGTLTGGGGFGGGLPSGGVLGNLLMGLPTLFQGAFAEGGDFVAGKPMIVGDRGTELLVPPTSGSVLNHRDLMAALAGAGGGTTHVHQHFNISTPNPEAFRQSSHQMMQDAWRSAHRAGMGGRR